MCNRSQAEQIFQNYRPLLFAVAYRMTGSGMEADDLVQETYLRWQTLDLAEIESPKAMLTTIITRLAIDHLRSARVRRETYVGNWLPEPLVHASEYASMQDASHSLLLAESLTTAFLVLLEKLNPVERAAFLLHDIFDYDYADIADIIDKSPANTRQIVKRARDHLQDRPRFEVDADTQARLLQSFVQAAQHGDMTPLLDHLTTQAILWADGGGRVTAALNPIYGRDKVVRALLGFAARSPNTVVHPTYINGLPGWLLLTEGALHGTISFQFVESRIQSIYITVNPDKLQKPAQTLQLPLYAAQ